MFPEHSIFKFYVDQRHFHLTKHVFVFSPFQLNRNGFVMISQHSVMLVYIFIHRRYILFLFFYFPTKNKLPKN